MTESETGIVETRVERVVAFIQRSERHRLAVISVVGILFLVLVVGSFGPNLGLIPFGLTVLLVLFLYTRPSSKATMTGSATGPGTLCLGLYLYQVTRTITGASTEPVATTLMRHSQWLGIGIALLLVGGWLHRSLT